MADIELRWLETRRPLGSQDAEGNWIEQYGYAIERVLQCRTRLLNMGNGYQKVGAGDGNTFVAYERPMGWSWSEWQDVPIEASTSTAGRE